MNIQTLSPIQIRNAGVEALTKILGPIGMVRFLHYFENGVGDYTKERKSWINKISIQDIVKDIKRKR